MAGLVAVTGATGFVGSRIVRALAGSGWQVRILARHMPTAALSRKTCLDVVLGDLNDSAALQALVKDADLVIHVAGIVKARHPGDFQTVNAGGTIKLLEALNAANPTARLIHISSITAREPQLSPYAASKAAGEAAVERLAGARKSVILRPPAVYGPGDLEILPLFKAAATGFCPYPAAPDARVSVIHVEDLARAVAALANAATWPAARYEVDDGRSYSWDEILTALGKALGRSVTGFRLPCPLLYPIAAASQLAQALTGEQRVLSLAKIPELYHPDWVAKGPSLQRDLGFRPEQGLNYGFQNTVAWYRANSLIN